MANLNMFIGRSQYTATQQALAGEEGQAFMDILNRLDATIDGMPTPYATDGQGDAAIAYLHYFRGNMDWYILERDVNANDAQLQAFGYADLGYGAELGYINIHELIGRGVELDYYFKPTAVRNIGASPSAR